MAAPLQKFIWTGTATDNAVDAFLVQASLDQGGVWFARGIFGQVTIYQFKTVSSIPDAFAGATPRPILWKQGKQVGFTKTQIIRDQNRNFGQS